MRLHRIFALTAALEVITAGAWAQSAPPPGWEFSITPYGWLPAIRGTIRQLPLPACRKSELRSRRWQVGDRSRRFSRYDLGRSTLRPVLDPGRLF